MATGGLLAMLTDTVDESRALLLHRKEQTMPKHAIRSFVAAALAGLLSVLVMLAPAPAGATPTWLAPVALSTAGEEADEPKVAVDAQGDAVAVWQHYTATNFIVEASGYDSAGPLLDSLQIPATGIARQPVSFSVSPFDVWSALGTTSWSFGDGTSASGTSVTHTYAAAAAGSYHVTLTSADALGNTSSTSATITISRATTKLQPPAITAARLTNTRFRVARQATAITAKKTPLGTTVRFTLSAAAKLQITITSTAAGLRHGRSCLAPTAKLKRAHAKHCTRTLTVGHTHTSQRAAGSRQRRLQRTHRLASAHPPLLQGGPQREQRGRTLKLCDVELRHRSLARTLGSSRGLTARELRRYPGTAAVTRCAPA
jgi:hypothetical protein